MARIIAYIHENERIGVSVGRRWDPGKREPSEVVAIYWEPGDPNYLAYAILRNVHDEEVKLILHGETYMVRKIS